jgi:pimeloyl-ACP methyl ester carboxylesterase
MEMLYKAGLHPFAMDFRGFGGTPLDSSAVVVPNRCVKDVECVLEFLKSQFQRQEIADNSKAMNDSTPQLDTPLSANVPSLLGWSQGSLS